jgi:hypothetical protein
VNAWNQRSSLSRAYVNDAGNPYIESDLDVEGGVSIETIRQFIKTFRSTLKAYIQFLATDAGRNISQTGTVPEYRKPNAATQRVQAPIGDFAVWLDPTKWKRAKSDDPNRLQFENVNGEAWFAIITERIGISTDALADIAFANAKEASPDARIIMQEKRIVNGREILALQIDGSMKKIPFSLLRVLSWWNVGHSSTGHLDRLDRV